MKVTNVFAHIFAIFAFLTIGSLLVIVSIHLLSLNDAILRIQQLYEDPWQSLRTGVVGLLFIMVGLIFTKMLVKTGRQSEALIVQSEMGPVVVSVSAIDDVVRKVLKRFHLVKDCKIKTLVQGKQVDIKLKFILWGGGQVPDLLMEIQDQIRVRVKKLLGNTIRLEINCDVQRIEDHEVDYQSVTSADREVISI